MNTEKLKAWLDEREITEVECLIPDMTGIARGKIMPAKKFLKEEGIRLPEGVFVQTVTGDWPPGIEESGAIDPGEIDMELRPDLDTVRLVPWASEPTAQIIHDCYYHDGSRVELSPRNVLRRVLELYEAQGWQPVVAPELEFFLTKINPDPDLPLEPPVGRTGRAEVARQSYGIDAVNEFDPLFEEMYRYCEAQELDIDTLIHEGGAAQMEINFLHGEALQLADQVFLFKRTVREVAIRHKMYATFMARPLENEPGSAMHVHQSVVSVATGENVFSLPDGSESPLFRAFIAGQQKYTPAVMAFLAPNVNSYRRLAREESAPINIEWAYDNRTVGLRVPVSGPLSRRVENRVAGADANPYLALAANLASGYLGMMEKREPDPAFEGNAYKLPFGLPRTLADSLALLESSTGLKEILGERFVQAYVAVKRHEHDTFFRVISSWEREHLLLNV